MNVRNHVYASIVLSVVFAAGCESVALMPRPDIDRRDYDPGSVGRGRESPAPGQARNEVVGTVQRIDESASEIHLRTSEGRSVVLKYDPRTVVEHRDRDLRVEDLRYGDVILVEVRRDGNGEQQAQLIRMNDRPS